MRMTKSQKIILIIMAISACALSLGIFHEGIDLYRDWSQKPLGPALDSTPWELPATWTVEPNSLGQTRTPLPTFGYETETPVPPFFSCADLPTMMLLGIGSDARSNEYKYGRSDVIRAIRVDFQTQRVTVLAFPRDLWVKIPEVRDNLGTNQQKLNTAYYWGNPGLHYWDHPSEGPGLLARTLDRNFGLDVDHYLAVSMNVFVDVVDALGGLDITLEEEIDGRYAYDQSERLYFPAGQNHLTGEQALTLARNRKGSVFNRMDYQNLVVCTLQKKLKSPDVIPQIPTMISSFQKNVQTDLTPLQLSQLACLGTQMPISNIVFSSFPRNTFRSGEIYDPVGKYTTFIWQADFDEMKAYVEMFEAGTWPVISPSSSEEPESGTSGCE